MPSLNPYLSFKNEAREAMEFYRSVFGGELRVSTFAATGEPAIGAKFVHPAPAQRSSRNSVSPLVSFHRNCTCGVTSGVAVKPVGAGGGVVASSAGE